MTLTIYRVLVALLSPLLSFFIWHRRRRGKEDPVRFPERRGVAGQRRPAGTLLWFHGASVGEAMSVLPLVDHLLAVRSDLHILVTTGTVSSAKLLADRLPQRAIHQYVPIDRSRDIKRFLDHWHPDIAIWIESELWPNLIASADERSIPLFLIQGRLSARSFRRWTRFGGFARDLIGRFTTCLTQDEVTADRFRQLGARDVHVIGNLKQAAPPLPVNPTELAMMVEALGTRPSWVAASTHPGEEEIIADAAVTLRRVHPDLLTIIAPRHPTRATEVADILSARGLSTAQRSKRGSLSEADVFIVDTIGELGLFYRLSKIAFVGGSLVAHGGQNPMEAARLGCAVLHGPNMTNFEGMAAELTQANASIEVVDGLSLARHVGQLLADPTQRRAIAERAEIVSGGGTEIVEQLSASISTWLGDPAPDSRAAANHAHA